MKKPKLKPLTLERIYRCTGCGHQLRIKTSASGKAHHAGIEVIPVEPERCMWCFQTGAIARCTCRGCTGSDLVDAIGMKIVP